MDYQGVSMLSFIALILLYSSASFANVRDCDSEMDQEERNECMAFERDRAVGKLMSKVTKECAGELEDRDAEDDANYPMLLDKCMTKKLLKLSESVD